MLKIIGINANGISSKLQSLQHIINSLEPSVICLQETKLRKGGKLKSNDYVTFELVRKNSAGGGLATLVKKDLDPVWISEGDDITEVLVVEIHIENLPVRIINAYGPQESDSIERKTQFWARLHTEVNDAIEKDIGVILQMDGNLHAGEALVKDDPNKMNNNGKLFSMFLANNQSMTLLNASSKCEGTITRKRIKGGKIEQAVLDFALVSDNIAQFFQKMVIDEERKYPLSSYLAKKCRDSDHFTLIMDFDIQYKRQKPVREEYFNFKNVENQESFRDILNSENNLTKCFENSDGVEKQTERWFAAFNNIVHRSFKKIRVSGKSKESESVSLLRKRTELLQKIKIDPNNDELKEELEKVVEQVTEIVSKENRDKIFNNFQKLDQSEGENFAYKVWDIKNKVFPKVAPPVPAAKIDINGRMVTDPNGIKNLYLETFTHRLRQRPVKQHYAELFLLQQKLCEKRLLISMTEKSYPWTEDDILKVLNSLKNGKCRDPLGMINEIFKPPVAGTDLVRSVTLMMNRIKDEMKLPQQFRMKNISTIYKNKGSRSDLENDRGIFTCTVLNNILQKLIYNDQYDQIDTNLSDSNIGARKRKNIRNHSFIVNGIINEAVQSKTKNIDINVMDYRQCFDALSVDVSINDLYDIGVQSDHLKLISVCDSASNIAIKTPVGITRRVDIQKIVAQGEVMSPLKCTVSVDAIASSHEVILSDHLYRYKNQVSIPPLTMVDDSLVVTNCGLDSNLATAHLNAQTNIKKLQYGQAKCNKIHIGKSDILCPKNTIDAWKLVKQSDEATSILDYVDTEADRHEMASVVHDKYLGDVLQNSGKNTINIQERIKRGFGSVNQICQLLDDLCLGSYHFECANIFRNSMLLSTLLSNSDAWYNVTSKEIAELESVDEMFLRKVLSAHSKTSLELLYLETGNIPIRFILISKRLGFLHYILNEEEDTLIQKFFSAQNEYPAKGDWVVTVKQDLTDLDINLSFDQIKNTSKQAFKDIVKEKIKSSAFNMLTKLQQTKSKSKNLHYTRLELQAYLKSNDTNIKEKSSYLLQGPE